MAATTGFIPTRARGTRAYGAIRLDVGVRNAKGQLANFFRAKDAILQEFQREYEAQAERMRKWAFDYMERTPVWDTGFMARNLKVNWSHDRNNFELGWQARDFMVPETKYRFYPPFVEWGTERMRPRYILSKTNQALGHSVSANMSKAAKRALARTRIR